MHVPIGGAQRARWLVNRLSQAQFEEGMYQVSATNKPESEDGFLDTELLTEKTHVLSKKTRANLWEEQAGEKMEEGEGA